MRFVKTQQFIVLSRNNSKKSWFRSIKKNLVARYFSISYAKNTLEFDKVIG